MNEKILCYLSEHWIAILALLIAGLTHFLNFWWRGKILVYCTRFYTVGQINQEPYLLLPLSFINTGPKVRTVCNVSLKVVKETPQGENAPLFFLMKELKEGGAVADLNKLPDAVGITLSGKSGVSKNLLFKSPYSDFRFEPGRYIVEIHCAVDGDNLDKSIDFTINLSEDRINSINKGYAVTDYFKSSHGMRGVIPIKPPGLDAGQTGGGV